MRSFKMEWTREKISQCRGDDIDVPMLHSMTRSSTLLSPTTSITSFSP